MYPENQASQIVLDDEEMKEVIRPAAPLQVLLRL